MINKLNLNPNGFFIINNEELSFFNVGSIIAEGRRGVFPTLEGIYSTYQKTTYLKKAANSYSVVAVCIDGVGAPYNGKLCFQSYSAKVHKVYALCDAIEVCDMKKEGVFV